MERPIEWSDEGVRREGSEKLFNAPECLVQMQFPFLSMEKECSTWKSAVLGVRKMLVRISTKLHNLIVHFSVNSTIRNPEVNSDNTLLQLSNFDNLINGRIFYQLC